MNQTTCLVVDPNLFDVVMKIAILRDNSISRLPIYVIAFLGWYKYLAIKKWLGVENKHANTM